MRNLIIAIMVYLLASGMPLFAAPHTTTEADVSALERSALSGNRKDIRTLFNLYEQSDGCVAEYIDIVLGGTICKYPQIFLEELKRSNRKSRLDSLVGNTGPELVDRFQEQAAELKRRKEALLAVQDSSVSKIRDACVDALERQIKGKP